MYLKSLGGLQYFKGLFIFLSTGSTGRKLRHPKRFMAIPSPITAVEWWRVGATLS